MLARKSPALESKKDLSDMRARFRQPRRVCITGLGCVTPIGTGRAAFFDSLRQGISGVRRIESFDVSDSPVKIAAEITDFDPLEELPAKELRHVPRTVPLALRAARLAIEDAKLYPNDMTLDERRRTGVMLGTGGGGLAFTEKQYGYFYSREYSKASVYTIPASTHGGLSSELSMRYNLRGLSHVISTGCTSSTDAIAYAAEHIAQGRADVMLAGGVDAPLAPGILADLTS
jgi:3-oxoacyl-[acyl-carrier-protein] synthase II